MRSIKLIIAVSATLLLGSSAHADSLDELLKLVPPDAGGVVAVADLARLSGDIDECIARMDRKESLIAGRPVDQLRGALGIREGLDEKGSLAMWWKAGVAGEAATAVMLIPSEDPAQFVKVNVEPGADGKGTFGGKEVWARTLAKHVLISVSKEAIDNYSPAQGIATVLATRLGERGMTVARRADALAWASKAMLAQLRAGADQMSDNAKGESGLTVFGLPVAAQAKAAQALADGVSDVLIAVDADPLGLSVRSIALFEPGSELAKLGEGAHAIAGDGGGALKGLPSAPFFLAFGVDADALGGTAKLDELAGFLGASDYLPEWLATAKAGVHRVRFACYPSKLGVLAGGVLNDCSLVIETDNPGSIRELFKSSLLAQEGAADGVRRTPTWEDGRTLKDGTIVDAFELKETPLGPSEAEGVDLSGVAMRQFARQAIFGTRGMHGFFKSTPTSVVITFSQRPDVLGRAIGAAQGGSSLCDDSVLKSMQEWMIPGAQIEAFVSIGQIVKLARNLADAFGAGGMEMPSIPTKSAPIAIAFRWLPGNGEFAMMIPTPVLAGVFDQVMAQAKRRLSGDAPDEPSDAAGDPRP